MEGISSFTDLFVRGCGGPIGQELNLLIQSQFSVSWNNNHFSIYILVTILSWLSWSTPQIKQTGVFINVGLTLYIEILMHHWNSSLRYIKLPYPNGETPFLFWKAPFSVEIFQHFPWENSLHAIHTQIASRLWWLSPGKKTVSRRFPFCRLLAPDPKRIHRILRRKKRDVPGETTKGDVRIWRKMLCFVVSKCLKKFADFSLQG